MAVDWNDPSQAEFNKKITDAIFPYRRDSLRREGERHAEFMKQLNASKGTAKPTKGN